MGEDDDVLDLSLKQSHSAACSLLNDVRASLSSTLPFSATVTVTSSPVIPRQCEQNETQASLDAISRCDEDRTDQVTRAAFVAPVTAVLSSCSVATTGRFSLLYSQQLYPNATATSTTANCPPLFDLFVPSSSLITQRTVTSTFTGSTSMSSVSDSTCSALKQPHQHSVQASGSVELLEDSCSGSNVDVLQSPNNVQHQLSLTSYKRCSSEPLRLMSSDDMDDGVAYVERRRKNNEAAKRSRDARRLKEQQTALRAAALEQENIQLRAELAVLRNQAAKLHCLLYNKVGI